MSQENDLAGSSTSESQRPDPAFKEQTRRVAEAIGIESVATEFPQTLRGDLVMYVPFGLALIGTLFSFFFSYNVLEFKG